MINIRFSLSFRLAALGSLVLLGACQNAEAPDPAATEDAAAPAEAAAMQATLSDQAVEGFDGITIPMVAGIDAAAAKRINTVLASVRDEAATKATECRNLAETRPFTYELTAQPTLNANGLLSLRMVGEAFCGGANGATLTDARTFDLRDGSQVDVVAASGRSDAELAALAAANFDGEAGCRTFMTENADNGEVGFGSAYVTPIGVGVNLAVGAGAAESCAAQDAVIGWQELGTVSEPLAKVAG